MAKEAIVLLNMGGPNNLEEVEVFLTNMFNDENILTLKSPLARSFIATMITFFRTQKAQEIYRLLGGKSPLVELTQKLVDKLQKRAGDGVVVDFAMRYTPPFSDEVIKRLNDKKVEKIYLIPLYPQYSTTTTKSSLEEFEQSYHRLGGDATLVEIKHFFQNEFYNSAILEQIKKSVTKDEAKEFDLIFSAHGLPQKIVDRGDVYEKHINKHVALLSDMLKDDGYNFAKIHLAYQSKVGPMAWLKPSLDEKLKEIKNKKALIYPVAFTIDNSETIYELSMEYAHTAKELGFSDYRVASCPNDSEKFVDALMQIYGKLR